jgi:hypothetical protein
MAKCISKQLEFDVIQWTEDNFKDVLNFCDGYILQINYNTSPRYDFLQYSPNKVRKPAGINLDTHFGNKVVGIGDYILRNNDLLIIIHSEDFERFFEKVEEVV